MFILKIIFKIKNIILVYLRVKNILKNNHIPRHWPSSRGHDGILPTACFVYSFFFSPLNLMVSNQMHGCINPIFHICAKVAISKSEDLNEIQRTILVDGMICWSALR